MTADHQSLGRGQHGRSWVSSQGAVFIVICTNAKSNAGFWYQSIIWFNLFAGGFLFDKNANHNTDESNPTDDEFAENWG